MNLNFTWKEAAEAAGGTLTRGNASDKFSVITTDSRAVTAGTVFLALKGKVHDAHKFLPQVIAAGAAGIIINNGEAAALTEKPTHILEVPDTLRALQAIAARYRDRFDVKIAAVTGSNGKSTTKEMLRAIFENCGKTCANKGNLNNQYGVPFSLFELAPDDEYAVFELGASQEGDIDEIARLVRPDVGVITNVSPAHLEFFHDVETIYRTKTEIARHIKPGGTLVYNTDNEYLRRLKGACQKDCVTFGVSQDALFRPEQREYGFAISGPDFSLDINRELPPHNRLNACAAAAAAWKLEISPEKIKKGLEAFTPMPMRLQVEEKKGVRFILDAYNANPASMQAALTALVKGTHALPLVAVLGDMKELGAHSPALHRELGEWIAKHARPDTVFLSGPEIFPAVQPLEAAGVAVKYYEKGPDMLPDLRQTLAKGGTCLIKASRAMGFETIFKEF